MFSCLHSLSCLSFFFFFNDTATTEIYTLSLHDALPICHGQVIDRGHGQEVLAHVVQVVVEQHGRQQRGHAEHGRSEEHTSELQSRQYLVCRLLLEKKKKYAGKTLESRYPRHLT